MIERRRGRYIGRNKASAYKDLVWTVATASDDSLDLAEQTRESLAIIEQNLTELNSDKTRIVSAVVYITRIEDKAIMDAQWNTWIGDNPDHWPQRACVAVQLAGNTLVEITVQAIRKV